MRVISEERVKRFWKWCGFEDRWDAKRIYIVQWHYPDGNNRIKLPQLTPNNMFKWAVPKLAMYELNSYNEDGMHSAWVAMSDNTWKTHEDKNPTMALFLAIEKLIVEVQK